VADHGGAAGPGAAGHPVLRHARDRGQPIRAVGPQPDLRRFLAGCAEQHRLAVDRQHLPDLQAGRGDRVRAALRELFGGGDQQPPGATGVGGPDDPAVAGPGRNAGHEIQPAAVGVLPQDGHRAPRRVGRQQPHPALITALHRDQRVIGVPVHRHQVREGGLVGVDQVLTAVQAELQQRHVRVRGAGRRVGDLGAGPSGLGRVGDVPPVDAAGVHPGHQQGRPVRRPPVAALPPHLLRRDELGQPVTQPWHAVRPDELPVITGGQVGDPQRARVHAGDHAAGGIGPGIQRGHGGRYGTDDLLARPGPQIRQVDPARHRERGQVEGVVGGEGHDPARLLAGPLPPGPFLGRLPGRLLLAGPAAARPGQPGPAALAGRQCGRIGHQPLLAGIGVEQPQAGHRVGAALAAQEGHPAAVRGDLERARHTQAEPLGPGPLAGETVGHAPILPAGRPSGAGRLARLRQARPRTRPVGSPGAPGRLARWLISAGCCWCTHIRTTSRSRPGRPWPPTPHRARASPWSPARWGNWARSSHPAWPTWRAARWGSTGSASWPRPVPRWG
jgi:hypothetical protein